MNIEIANRLQKLRKEKGYSQEQLADELGISRQAVSKWERAESSPDTDNLICLAKLYGVSLDYLLDTEDSIEEIKEQQIQTTPKLSEEELEELEDEKIDSDPVINAIKGSIVFVMTILYLVMGSIWGLWFRAWTVFLLIPVFTSLAEAIKLKKASRFVYPAFATFVYFTIGYCFSLWHPGWIVFVTIPLYYSIVNAFNKNED